MDELEGPLQVRRILARAGDEVGDEEGDGLASNDTVGAVTLNGVPSGA